MRHWLHLFIVLVLVAPSSLQGQDTVKQETVKEDSVKGDSAKDDGPKGVSEQKEEKGENGEKEENARKVLIRDLATVEGVRDNPVIGYGLVAGLRGTGDKQQTIFTNQTLANMLQRMGVQVPPTTMIVKNVAAVFVTATLPPFASPGMRLDVTVSSIGDAKTLDGGTLMLTPLYGADGQIYGEAQGPLTLGGYREGNGGTSKQLNHPTVGRIPNGGLVERTSSVDLNKLAKLSLLLNDSDFSTAEGMAGAVNLAFKGDVASVVDARRVDINAAVAGTSDLPALLARVENLTVEVHRRARVVVNERTGTVVMLQRRSLGFGRHRGRSVD